MEQKTTSQASSSSPIWERLEAFVREQVQRLISPHSGTTRSEEPVRAESIKKLGVAHQFGVE